jgi:hypothetical protein
MVSVKPGRIGANVHTARVQSNRTGYDRSPSRAKLKAALDERLRASPRGYTAEIEALLRDREIAWSR